MISFLVFQLIVKSFHLFKQKSDLLYVSKLQLSRSVYVILGCEESIFLFLHERNDVFESGNVLFHSVIFCSIELSPDGDFLSEFFVGFIENLLAVLNF